MDIFKSGIKMLPAALAQVITSQGSMQFSGAFEGLIASCKIFYSNRTQGSAQVTSTMNIVHIQNTRSNLSATSTSSLNSQDLHW